MTFYRLSVLKEGHDTHLQDIGLAEDLFNHNNIKSLSGELQGSYRLRVGNIRIVYSIDDSIKIVYIEVIGFRSDVYKKKIGFRRSRETQKWVRTI